MIVDAHTHIVGPGHWPAEWWDWVARDWASKEPGRKPEMVRDRIEANLVDHDGARMVEHLDEAGIDVAVNLPIDWGEGFTAPASVEEQQEQALRCAAAFPDRLVSFAGIDPRRDEADRLLDHWLHQGLRGLKLYPPVGYAPDHPTAMKMYEVCLRHDVPVLFHTGAEYLPLLDGAFASPALLEPVVDAFPDLMVWIGHSGAMDHWSEALEVARRSRAACLELSVWLWRDPTPDQEAHLATLVGEAIEVVGPDRLLFGTDHVSGAKERGRGFASGITEAFHRLPETMARLGHELTEDDRAKLMGGNAARCLKLSTSHQREER